MFFKLSIPFLSPSLLEEKFGGNNVYTVFHFCWHKWSKFFECMKQRAAGEKEQSRSWKADTHPRLCVCLQPWLQLVLCPLASISGIELVYMPVLMLQTLMVIFLKLGTSYSIDCEFLEGIL